MKIERVKNEDVRNFDDLKVGEAFRPVNYFSTDLLIKTYDFICYKCFDHDDDEEDNQYNAIHLLSGKPYWIESFEKVVVPNCKIVVE